MEMGRCGSIATMPDEGDGEIRECTKIRRVRRDVRVGAGLARVREHAR